MHSAQTPRAGTVMGFPLAGFSLFQSLLLAFASAFFAFFASTCLAIFGLLAWNLIGHHAINYADTYRDVGFPAGVFVLVIALPFFLILWLRGKFHK